jgi:allantoinase
MIAWRAMRAFRSRRVVTPEGMRAATLVIDAGRVARVDAYDASGIAVEDVGGTVVMPGVVDAHVHINDPGRMDWEGFESATRAAAAGGVTTIVDMPLNSIPATIDTRALAAKHAAAAGRLAVDVGLWGGVVPGNANALADLWRGGVLGFKCFLVPSGVSEFPQVGERDLNLALPILARLDAPLLVHAELPRVIERASADSAGDPRLYQAYLATRPVEAETEAIDLVVKLADRHRARVHIVHVSSGRGAASIASARRRGVRITGETCPHYLTFAAEEIADGATVYKCAPPIRASAERDALWTALAGGVLDFVASDHSPAPPSMKAIDRGDFATAWGGIASLQLLLPAVWTPARQRGVPLDTLSDWLCARPAAFAGLAERKGTFNPGSDADIVIWDPDASFEVDPRRLHHRHPLTPYAGRTLYGVVRKTLLRGEVVYDGTRHPVTDGGQIVAR